MPGYSAILGVIAAQASAPPATPPAGLLPIFRNAVIKHGSTSSVEVQYPANVAAGDFLLLALLNREPADVTIIDTPDGFNPITGWGVVTSPGQGDDSRLRLRGYWKKAVGGESGVDHFVFSTGSISSSTIMARFSGAYPDAEPIAQLGSGVGHGAPLTMPTLTTTIDRRLGVAVATFGNDVTFSSFIGGSGPSWTLRTQSSNTGGADRTIALHTCDLSIAGTSSAHQDTSPKSNNNWAIARFALLPNPTGV